MLHTRAECTHAACKAQTHMWGRDMEWLTWYPIQPSPATTAKRMKSGMRFSAPMVAAQSGDGWTWLEEVRGPVAGFTDLEGPQRAWWAGQEDVYVWGGGSARVNEWLEGD